MTAPPMAGCVHFGTEVSRLNCARSPSSESVKATEMSPDSTPSTAYHTSELAEPRVYDRVISNTGC